MESTSELNKSFDQLLKLSKETPTENNICAFDIEIKYLTQDIRDVVRAGSIEDLGELRCKIKEVVKLGQAFLIDEDHETDDEMEVLKNEVRIHLLFLKMFTSAACLSLPVHLSYLREICLERDEELGKHLDEIGEGFELPCTTGKKFYYLNRYSNSMPYDDHRVELTSGRYIAASDTHFDDKRYLIASAPFVAFIRGKRINTLEDWWTMILECNTRLIVMTTNMKEGRTKCHNYFTRPEIINDSLDNVDQDWTCQSVKTTKLESRNKQSIFKRTITMSHLDGETREITHLQYYNWPDFGVADPKLFLKFQRLIAEEESQFPTKEHPPLFHCSAGLGRSGTTLALHFLLEHLEESKEPLSETPDIDACITSLRSQRKGLVASAVQYKFIARVLIEYFQQKIGINERETV